jgi:hypothetical protein
MTIRNHISSANLIGSLCEKKRYPKLQTENCCYGCEYLLVVYVLLTVHLDAIMGIDQLDALFLNVFILRLYMIRAASAHHQEGQVVLIPHLV